MTTIWQEESGAWEPIAPSGFSSEAALHDAVFAAPDLLPLAGSPRLAVLGREVLLGSGYADVLAVEPSGRLTVIEVKLAANAEARRAVVAQILAYAAALHELDVEALEQLLAPKLAELKHAGIHAAAVAAAQGETLDPETFRAALRANLEKGEFRLVLVLDEAPAELVRLVGYLDHVAPSLLVDLVAVTGFEVGARRVLVPQRLDPDRKPVVQGSSGASPVSGVARPQESSDAFAARVAALPAGTRKDHERLLDWARSLEAAGVARLYSTVGTSQDVLQIRVPGEQAGIVTIWSYSGKVTLTVYESALARRAPKSLEPIREVIGDRFGKNLPSPDDSVLAALAVAYREAVRA